MTQSVRLLSGLRLNWNRLHPEATITLMTPYNCAIAQDKNAAEAEYDVLFVNVRRLAGDAKVSVQWP